MCPSFDVVIERASELPSEPLLVLVDESLREGFGFVARLRDEWEAARNRFDQPGEALFFARSGERLVGVCGLNRDPFAGDPGVGRLRHLYVSPSHRRVGVGRLLTAAALEHAKASFRSLRLRTDSEAAAAFYLALGFSPAADDAHATHELAVARG
jgi:ribosomal protein S18 acetylase RimI-like enzyme